MLDLEEARLGADVIDARVATEIEILTSAPIVERAVTRLDLAHDPAFVASATGTVQRAVRAARRDRSLVIEVGVAIDDPQRAAELCNAILESYLERSMESRMEPALHQIEWLTRQLEELPEGDPRRQVEARLAALEVERAAITPGARLLERCTMR